MPLGTGNQLQNMLHAFNKVASTSKCGVDKDIISLKRAFGTGSITTYKFEGVTLSLYNIHLKQELEYRIHQKDEFVLFSFLLQGQQLFMLNENKKVISYEGNETYWVRANNLKGHVRFLADTPWKEVRISMSERFVERHQLSFVSDFSSSTCLDQIKPRLLSSKELFVLFEILEDKRESFLKRLFLEAKILELFSQSMTEHSNTTRDEDTTTTLLQGAFTVCQLLEANLNKSYSIPELARIVGINESSLQKQFKKVFNKTIFEYALEVKMKRAKELLSNSSKQIYEISNEVGYKNPTHFTAAFKRLCSCTPKNYRSQVYMR